MWFFVHEDIASQYQSNKSNTKRELDIYIEIGKNIIIHKEKTI